MTKKNEKVQKQPEKKPTLQFTTPVKPVVLTDEELGQVVGGIAWGGPTKNPDPTLGPDTPL